MTIKRKFLICVLLVFVALSSVGTVAGIAMRDSQREQVRRSLDAIANLENRRVADTLEATAHRLVSPTTEAVVAPLLAAFNRTGSATTAGEIGLAFDELMRFLPAMKAGTIVALDGSIVTAQATSESEPAPREIDPGFLDIARGRIGAGDASVVGPAFRVTPDDERYLHVLPLSIGGDVVGYLVAECDLQPVQALLSRASELGDTAESHLVQEGTDGSAQFITDLRFEPLARFGPTIPATDTDKPAIRAISGPDSIYEGLADYRDEQVLAATRRVPGTPWALVVKIDEQEAYGPFNRAAALGLAGLAIAALASFVVVSLAFRSAISRVKRVAETATKVGDGDLTARVADRSPDEIGQLGRAVDRMTDTLVADMARRHQVEAELAHRARHDVLTGLPNRAAFQAELKRALSLETTPGTVAVLFCDLDEFKSVNDDLGHSAGDALLVEVARRLQGAVGPAAMLARFGGDEFVVVAQRLGREAEAVELAERMRQSLTAPVSLAGRDAYVTTSVGVAISRAGSSAETLVRDADTAMYCAKEVGRHRVVLHDALIGARASNRIRMTTELRRAIANGGLSMALQPIVDMETGETRAWEALVRWAHEGKEIDPAEFVVRATELDLAGELDRWVLGESCRVMCQLSRVRVADTGWLHVNVTGHSLVDPTFADDVLSVLAFHKLPPSALCVEIVEDRLGGAPQAALRTLRRLRHHGVHVAIDDFGTGHSSLARLRDLPADIVKIDQSFVRELVNDPTVEAITSAIVSLCKRLQLDVIAEGVEEPDQRDALLRVGCRLGQGYLMAAPRPANEVLHEVVNG
jgi:diguanylate cyclase (GGDEF)-like protein